MRNLKLSFFRVIRGLIILLSAIGFSSFAVAQKTDINVLTYNIRFANPDDAPNTWDQRKEKVFSLVRDAKPDIFGLQEALKIQVSDFEKAFPSFIRIGVGRDDGKESGEYSPLFFNSKKYNLVSSGTFWLSQTPSVAGSRGWDAACNRVVTWVHLKDKKSNALFFVFCTHFDHMGEIARRNSAGLLLQAVDSLASYNPAIVLGDFNAIPGSEPYNLITDFSNRFHLKDARLICTDLKGPEYTFTGFKVGAQSGVRIDYIFVKNNVQVLSFNVNEANNSEYYPSDHLPVNATMKIY
jgi:endonuclease/exonuclease/phosphatase family metal-dependent hydrolase